MVHRRRPKYEFSSGWDVTPEQLGLPAEPETESCLQSRRVFLGNLPSNVTEYMLLEFFNRILAETGTIRGVETPVLHCQVLPDQSHGFLELYSSEACDACLKLDGIAFQGIQLSLKRPMGYQMGDTVMPGAGPQAGVIQSQAGPYNNKVPDGPFKTFIGNIPISMSEKEIYELVHNICPIRYFNLIKDPHTGTHRGFAFCEFEDTSKTSHACHALNGHDVGGSKPLTAHLSDSALKSSMPVGGAPTKLGTEFPRYDVVPTIAFTNIRGMDKDDVREDVRGECMKVGRVRSIFQRHDKLLVEFRDAVDALHAINVFEGREFDGHLISVEFSCR